MARVVHVAHPYRAVSGRCVYLREGGHTGAAGGAATDDFGGRLAGRAGDCFGVASGSMRVLFGSVELTPFALRGACFIGSTVRTDGRPTTGRRTGKCGGSGEEADHCAEKGDMGFHDFWIVRGYPCLMH